MLLLRELSSLLRLAELNCVQPFFPLQVLVDLESTGNFLHQHCSNFQSGFCESALASPLNGNVLQQTAGVQTQVPVVIYLRLEQAELREL